MQINEIQKQTGLSKQTIIYYEKEKLIKPHREDNGYRNYNVDDLQTLLLIKFLRSLQLSIDDIKMFLEGKLSFEECLENNRIYISQQLENLSHIEKCIDDFQEKELPLIPQLAEIKSYQRKKGLGFRKTTDTVSIGRRLTRSLAVKKWIITTILTLCIESYILIGIIFIGTYDTSIKIILVLFLFLSVHTFILGHNFSLTTFLTHDVVDKTMNQSIEFLKNGISYYQFHNSWDNAKFYYAVIFNKKDKLFHYYDYEDIEKVIIKASQKKSMYGIMQFGYDENWLYDFEFHFKDNNIFVFNNPMILDNDEKYIAVILKEKVKNIVDEKNVLYAIEHQIPLDEYINNPS